MTTAYLISKGEYSDYSVYFVSLDRAVAEKIVARLNRDHGILYEIEERPLVVSGDEQVERIVYLVIVDREGREVERQSFAVLIGHERDDEGEARPDYTGVRTVGVSYVSYDVALKVARDELAEAKAEQGGLT